MNALVEKFREAIAYRNALEIKFHRFPFSIPALHALLEQQNVADDLASQIQSGASQEGSGQSAEEPQVRGNDSGLSRTEELYRQRDERHQPSRSGGRQRGYW